MPSRPVVRRRWVADDESSEAEVGIGAAIEALRIARGWSRDALAKKVQVDRSAIFRIETGQRIPNPDTVRKLAAALKISEEELRKTGWIAAAPDPRERWRRLGLAGAEAFAASALTRMSAPGAAAVVAPGPALVAAAAVLTGRSISRARLRRSKEPASQGAQLVAGRSELLSAINQRLEALDDDGLRGLLALLPEVGNRPKTKRSRDSA